MTMEVTPAGKLLRLPTDADGAMAWLERHIPDACWACQHASSRCPTCGLDAAAMSLADRRGHGVTRGFGRAVIVYDCTGDATDGLRAAGIADTERTRRHDQ